MPEAGTATEQKGRTFSQREIVVKNWIDPSEDNQPDPPSVGPPRGGLRFKEQDIHSTLDGLKDALNDTESRQKRSSSSIRLLLGETG
jgi:hypothetical protein